MIPGGSRSLYDWLCRFREELARRGAFPRFAVHCHNDRGLALANALDGMRAGATIIDASVLGWASVPASSIWPRLLAVLAQDFPGSGSWRLDQVAGLYDLVSGFSGVPVPAHFPVMGRNAFSHCAGVHSQAALHDPRLYQSLDPAPFCRTPEFVLTICRGVPPCSMPWSGSPPLTLTATCKPGFAAGEAHRAERAHRRPRGTELDRGIRERAGGRPAAAAIAKRLKLKPRLIAWASAAPGLEKMFRHGMRTRHERRRKMTEEGLRHVNPVLLALAATLFTWGVTALGAAMVFFFKIHEQKDPQHHAGLRRRGDDRRQLLVAAQAGHRDVRGRRRPALAAGRDRFSERWRLFAGHRQDPAPPAHGARFAERRRDQDLLAAEHPADPGHHPAQHSRRGWPWASPSASWPAAGRRRRWAAPWPWPSASACRIFPRGRPFPFPCGAKDFPG